MKAPKAPKPTAQQIAVERRQAAALDEEIREQEERFRAMARGKLGTKSLLGGVPRTRAEAATSGAGRAAPARTMLGMGGMAGGAARGGRGTPRTGTYSGTIPQLR
jgi:hypothetical protein